LLITTIITIKTLKMADAFERKVLRRMFGGIHLNGNWSKRYKELMQLLGDLGIISFVRISQLIRIGAAS
jgi:hypothetical protein